MNPLQKKTLIFGLIGLVIYVLLFIFADRPVDTWIHNNWADNSVHTAGTYISYLANGGIIRCAVAFGFVFLIATDPDRKKDWTNKLLFILVTAVIAMLIGDCLKIIFARYRPIEYFEHGNYGLHFLSKEWALNSTPSGHTIRAFSILTALGLLFRKCLPFFISLAVLIGLSRICVTAHWPSDVLFGAYIGVFAALWTSRFMNIEHFTRPSYAAGGRTSNIEH